MVSEKKESFEWVQKARELWPPELETIMKFLHKAEMISSKNNHIVYGDKATLFHGLKKFDDAIKNYELHMNEIDEKNRQQFKNNIKKAQQQQTIDYVYPWEDQLNYFNLTSFYKNTDFFIQEKNNFDDFLKDSWLNIEKIFKKIGNENSKEEMIDEFFSKVTREELSWCQRILHQKFPQIKYTDVNYKNFLQMFPKMIMITRLFYLDVVFLLIVELREKYDEILVSEILKIQKSLEKIPVNDELNTKILTVQLKTIENLINFDPSELLILKLHGSKPCEIELNYPISPKFSLAYTWFFRIDNQFNITFSSNLIYEELKNDLIKYFDGSWRQFLKTISNEKKFKNFQEYIEFMNKCGYRHKENSKTS